MHSNNYKKEKISIISPVYEAAEIVEKLTIKIIFNIKKITNNYELILIDDCSKDNSWKKLKNLKKIYKKLIIYKNKKNIGQHATIKAALLRATGDKIFILDCDLQDNPKQFLKFMKNWNNKFDAIIGISKANRYDKGIFSKIYWTFLSFFLKKNIPINITNFTLLSKDTKNIITKSKDFYLLYLELLKYNLKVKTILIEKEKKKIKSSYSVMKLIKLGLLLLEYK